MEIGKSKNKINYELKRRHLVTAISRSKLYFCGFNNLTDIVLERSKLHKRVNKEIEKFLMQTGKTHKTSNNFSMRGGTRASSGYQLKRSQ